MRTLLENHDNATLVSHALGLVVMVCEDAGMALKMCKCLCLHLSENLREYAVDFGLIPVMFEVIKTHAEDPLVLLKAGLVLFSLFWRNSREGAIL